MERINTIKPFAKGDVFVSCTWLDNEEDDHRGLGRIIQYDADLNEKGVLWTNDTEHFVVGIKFDRNNVLWGFDMHSHKVIHIDSTGIQRPTHHFADRAFGSAHFATNGDIYLGEYLIGEKIHGGTTSKKLPGSNILGYGNLHHFNNDWEFIEELTIDNYPELTGFKGFTHGSLHPSEEFITYTAETSKCLHRYNIQQKCQMSPLALIEGGSIYDKNWFIAMHYLRSGKLIVTRGCHYEVLDETGKIIDKVELGRYGWAQITATADERYIYSANVWTGEVCKVDPQKSKVIRMVETSNTEMTIRRQLEQEQGTYQGSRAPKRGAAGIAVFNG
ncbi:hypothetical protein [Oceanicoccus sp. KOV_DT_Chl]|uniref:hypothetical protein n=1 Tax=Oceanicoccus sp. KOV_DT_Chl TaxID=1904639 RepID=UPI000C7D18CE|nr:hypothetical protein [Oceanicoccus sp. KOV_DT_Chl]